MKDCFLKHKVENAIANVKQILKKKSSATLKKL